MTSLGRPASPFRLSRRLLPYLGRVRTIAAVTCALVMLSPIVGAALLWLVRLLVDDVLIGGRLALLPSFAALYFVVAAARFGLDYASMRLEAAIVERLIQDIRTELYRRLISASPASLGGRSVGDLLATSRATSSAPRIWSMARRSRSSPTLPGSCSSAGSCWC